jgi:hypothetical protein
VPLTNSIGPTVSVFIAEVILPFLSLIAQENEPRVVLTPLSLYYTFNKGGISASAFLSKKLSILALHPTREINKKPTENTVKSFFINIIAITLLYDFIMLLFKKQIFCRY